VRIVDGRIAEVSRQRMKGERELDGTGKFLIPGLIDSHVHLVFQVPSMSLAQEAAFPALAAAARAQEPRSYLFFGFTTVVDLNARPERIATWNSAEVRPDALFCGAAPVANGFPMNVIPPDVRFRASKYFLFDPRQADRIPAYVNASEHTPSAVVDQMAADGARCVKAHYEPGGPGSGPLPTPTADMFRGLVAAGRQHHLPVVIHANTKTGQRMALDAGADVIAHTIADGVGPDGKLTPDVDSLLSQIASRRVGFQPTLRALYGALALIDPNYLKDPRLLDAVPQALFDWFTTEDGTRYRDARVNGAGGESTFRQSLLAFQKSYAAVLSKLIAGHARLLFGSDSPATPSWGNLPGLNSRLEMDHWLAAGVTLRTLLQSLTIDNARAFGLDREIGTVEAGKRAHLLLLGANPLASVAAYDHIEFVIFAGRPIARATLSARAH